MKNEMYPIDVVLLWVDGADTEWQKLKARYTGEPMEDGGNCAARYRDWDNLQYLFRGIEKFMPWVDRVFFITNGQKPAWLNVDSDRLRFVTHSEFMPAEHLPTFNSNAIELNLHRIEDLSEHFILFNDDFFPLRPMPVTDFFRGGLPCDAPRMQTPFCIKTDKGFDIEVMNFCNMGLLNAHFRKKKVCKEKPLNWYGPYLGLSGMLHNLMKANQVFFSGFEWTHTAQPFLKSVFSEVWEKEGDYLWKTSASRLRNDLNATQYLMRYWQLASNRFSPLRHKARLYYELSDRNINGIVDCVCGQKADIVCLNDTEYSVIADADAIKNKLNAAFDVILPEKCSFEIG